MKRQAICLSDIASRENLVRAVWLAARGKKHRTDIKMYLQNIDNNLNSLSLSILNGTCGGAPMTRFTIHDPKRREICAALFDERVLHHAIMNVAHQRFERSQIDASFACRLGKGVHRAVGQVQKNLQRFPWVLRFDIQGYFASISHDCLKQKLARMFKGSSFLKLLDRIIDAHQPGLPIGLLTSQYFANAYLEELDHAMLAYSPARAYVRYMDDIAVWTDSLNDAQCVVENAKLIVHDRLGLIMKPNFHIGESKKGLLYCGFRVKPGVILPSSRKMTRFRRAIKAIAEHQSCCEQVLQRATDIALSGLHGTQAEYFRRSVFTEFGLLS